MAAQGTTSSPMHHASGGQAVNSANAVSEVCSAGSDLPGAPSLGWLEQQRRLHKPAMVAACEKGRDQTAIARQGRAEQHNAVGADSHLQQN